MVGSARHITKEEKNRKTSAYHQSQPKHLSYLAQQVMLDASETWGLVHMLRRNYTYNI